MKKFYVYKFLREDGTPYYIGKGTGNRIWKDWGRTTSGPSDKSRRVFVAKNLTEEQALELEVALIAFYGRKDLGTGILRNLTDGGEGASGHVPSEETRRKLSEAASGEGNPNYGKTLSEETRRKISEARRGKTLSEETRRKLSEAVSGEGNPNYGKTLSDEHRRKLSEAQRKVSREDVWEMRRLLSEGLLQREVGERLGVTRTVVRHYTSPKGRYYNTFR